MKNAQLQIRVSEELKKEIAEKAKSENKTISEYLLDLAKYDIQKAKEKS